ncbi:Protein transport protein Sec24A [Bulinus truncatus]|nr:Protein transport protein Sec24A [Bulinus truncatus]
MADRSNLPPVFSNSPLESQPSNTSQPGNVSQPAQLKPFGQSPNGPFFQPSGVYSSGQPTVNQPWMAASSQAQVPSNLNGFNPNLQQQPPAPIINSSGFPPPPMAPGLGHAPSAGPQIRSQGPYPSLPQPSQMLPGAQMNGPAHINSRPPIQLATNIGSQPLVHQMAPQPFQGHRAPFSARPVSSPSNLPSSASSGSLSSGDNMQSRPNELLPAPFQGQGQYSHQVNPHLPKTPIPTPSGSEPPSERSSRGPSPISGYTMDALEGQFSPAGTPSPAFQDNRGSPVSLPPGSMPQSSHNQQFSGNTPGQSWAGLPQQPQMSQYQSQPTFQASRPPAPQGFPPPPTSQVPIFPPVSGSQQRLPPPPTSVAGTGFQPPLTSMATTGFPTHPPQGYPLPPSSNTAGAFSPPPPLPSNTSASFPPPASGVSRYPPPPMGSAGPSSLLTGYSPSGSGDSMMPPPPSSQFGVTPPGVPLVPNQGNYSPHYAQPGIGGYPNSVNAMTQNFSQMGVQETQRAVNLLNERQLIPPDGLETPRPALPNDFKKVNCNPDIFRCTLNAIPQNSALLNKARLPLGILIHPFRDLSQLPVIQSSVIVRCRACRTYINPFVVFTDQRRWKCNLCFRVNDLPDEFSFDPVSKTYGDPQRRPEVKSATIEFIAPSEYMLRPPQPAVYLFLLDVSFNAVKTGYLAQFCQVLLDELDKLPGDARTTIGFLCFDKALYYFNLAEGLSQPQMLCVPDLEGNGFYFMLYVFDTLALNNLKPNFDND